MNLRKFFISGIAFSAALSLPAIAPQNAAAEQPHGGRGSLALPRGETYPAYSPSPDLAGPLTAVGSDSMSELLEGWSQAYRRLQPKLVLNMELRGSATGPAALIDGVTDLAPMARPMKKAELEEFQTHYGFDPTMIRVAVAAVGVYVRQDSPIRSISMRDLDAIFSKERKIAGGNAPATWADLGVSGDVAQEKVIPISGAPDSALVSYFRQQALDVAPFSERLVTVASTEALFETLSATPGGIAIGEVVPADQLARRGVKLLPVAQEEKGAVLPSDQALRDGKYPLGRYLLVYIVRAPGEAVEDATADFLRFVLSEEGQRIVRRSGLIPIPPEIARAQLVELQ